MKLIALFCYAVILSFHAITIAQTQAEARFLSNIERVLKDKEPEWDVKKIVLPPELQPEHLDNGKPLLSARGKWHIYEIKSKQWAGAISVFYGDSQRDAANQYAWLLRIKGRDRNSLREQIDDQSTRIAGKGIAEVISKKANVFVSVHIMLANLLKEDKSSEIEAKSEEGLEIAHRFTKHIIDQALTN